MRSWIHEGKEHLSAMVDFTAVWQLWTVSLVSLLGNAATEWPFLTAFYALLEVGEFINRLQKNSFAGGGEPQTKLHLGQCALKLAALRDSVALVLTMLSLKDCNFYYIDYFVTMCYVSL